MTTFRNETGDHKALTRRFYDTQAATYTDSNYGDVSEEYPANAIRLEHVLGILKRAGAKRVLDIGCGSGLPLLRMLESGFDAVGFDFSPRMVEESRQLLREQGQSPDRVTQGDIERLETFPGSGFDAAVALGVFPHVLDESRTLSNITQALRPGGLMVAEFRNALFSAFTLNRYSYDFYREAFLESPGALDPESELGRRADRYFQRAFHVEQDASKDEGEGADEGSNDISYSDLLAKFHNPLEMESVLESAGLDLLELVFYHFHVAPPVFEEDHREEFWRLSLQMEEVLARDWRGNFLASAFLAVAKKGV